MMGVTEVPQPRQLSGLRVLADEGRKQADIASAAWTALGKALKDQMEEGLRRRVPAGEAERIAAPIVGAIVDIAVAFAEVKERMNALDVELNSTRSRIARTRERGNGFDVDK